VTPVIIMAAPNGARRLKSDHPNIPLTIDETARECAHCVEAGAAMLHVHVRDTQGAHILDAGAYKAVTREIRRLAGPDPIIQITTEAVGKYSPEQQIDVVDQVRPEAVSVALRELVPDEASESQAAAFYDRRSREQCLVQHILYDAEDVTRFEKLHAKGIIPVDFASVLFVLGRYTVGQKSEPADLDPFLKAYTLDLPWMVCAFGARENECVTRAAELGGHMRIGFENNLHLPDGSLAPSTAALVELAAGSVVGSQKQVANSGQARLILSAQSRETLVTNFQA
jgi:uncharacterized protein (DUF849 family)